MWRAMRVPSFLTPLLMCTVASWRTSVEMKVSSRLNFTRTGRPPVWNASPMAMGSSLRPPLEPKPPPWSGLMRRICSCGRPRASDTSVSARKGASLATHTVTRPLSGSTWAWAEWGSMAACWMIGT